MTDTYNRPRANAILASSATLNDVFPQDLAFDIELDRRAYAVCARRDRDGAVLEPEVIAIDTGGTLHCFAAPSTPDGAWAKDSFALPELAGAVVTSICANEQDPATGAPGLVVQIAAIDASRRHVFLTVQRTDRGWDRLALPRSPIGPEMSNLVVASGVAGIGGGKLPMFYQCFERGPRAGLSVNAYAFTASGTSYTVALMDNPDGIDQLITPSLDWSLGLCRVESNKVKIFSALIDPRQIDHRLRILPVRFEMTSPRVFDLPIQCPIRDASAIHPVTDSRSLSHGIFILTPEYDLVACSFLSDIRADQTAVMTGRLGGPEDAREVAYSFGDDGAMHVFVSDGDGQIWYADWTLGARPDRLVWQPTGQTGSNLRAAQVISGEPRLFVAGDKSSIEMICRTPDSGDVWYRSAVVVPSDQQIAVAQVVHAIEINTVTVQSEPVPDEPLEIYADRPCVAECGGTLLRLGPEAPFRVPSGPSGGIRLRLRADGLEAPALRVRMPDRTGVPDAVFHPEDGALRKLAGLDPQFTMNGARLKMLRLAPAHFSDEQANSLADTLRQASRQSLRDGIDRPEQRFRRVALRDVPDAPAVAMSFAVEGDRVVAVAPSEVHGTRLRSFAASPDAQSPSGFWGWLSAKWEQVKRFTIQVVQGAVKFVVEAAGKVAEFFTSIGRYIERGLQAVLAFILKAGGKLLEIGRKLVGDVADSLGWDDVLRAKDAFKGYTLAALDDVRNLVDNTARNLISSGLQSAKGQVTALFDRAIGIVGGDGPYPSSKAGQSNLRAKIQQNGARINVVNGAVPQKAAGRALFELSPETRGRFDQVLVRARALPDNTRVVDLIKTLAAVFDGRGTLADGLQIVFSTVLSTVRELTLIALDLADALLNLLLDIVADVIDLMKVALVKPLTELLGGLGWIDTLYGMISGGARLTLIDLGCLIFVTPGVLLAHIVTGKEVVDEQKKPAEACRTPLGTVETWLSASMNPGSVSVPDNSVVTNVGVKAWMDYVQPVYRVCEAVWYLLKAPISILQNVTKVAIVKTDPPFTGANVLNILVSIADYALLVFSAAHTIVNTIGDTIEKMIRENVLLVLVVSLFLLLFIALGVIEVLVFWFGFRPIDSLIASAALDLILLGPAVLLYHIAVLIYSIAVSGGGVPDKDTRAYVDHSLGIFRSFQRFTHLGNIVGPKILNSPDPATATAAAVLIGANVGADVACPLVSGIGLAITGGILRD